MKNTITDTAQASLAEKKDHPVKVLPAGAQIRIPTQRPVPQLKTRIKKTTEQVSKEWTAEASHTDRLSSQLPSAPDAASKLAPKRIQRFHQKKTSSLLKKMAELHDQASQKIDHKVVAESSSRQKLEKAQDELWRDMMKPQVERHFQIDRLTNFFVK